MKKSRLKANISQFLQIIKKIVVIEKDEIYPENKKQATQKGHYTDFYHSSSEEILKHEEERIFGSTAKPEEKQTQEPETKQVYEPLDEELVNYLTRYSEEDMEITFPTQEKEKASVLKR